VEEESSGWEAFLSMVRVYIFCEGQTEETFVREVLQAHLNRLGVFLTPIVIRTSATSKGGMVRYTKLRWQIDHKCKEDNAAHVTSLIDLYGLPSDFPQKDFIDSQTDPYQKVQIAEKALSDDLNQRNFIPNLLLHEYEALLFSDLSKFGGWFSNDAVQRLMNDVQGADTPEHVNDNPHSAPSKRVLKYCPGYDKPVHGSLIAGAIGLDTIRTKCQHFNNWLSKIEQLEAKSG
jgi:hypothetical protein